VAQRIWVYAEVSADGVADPAALEILTKARELGDAEAVALGPGASAAAAELGAYGAQTVFVSDDEVYADYIAEPAVHALAELVREQSPEMVLFATQYDSRDIAGRLAAKLGSTLMSNAIGFSSADVAQTAILGGQTIVDVRLEGRPRIVLIRPKSFAPERANGDATTVPVDIAVPDDLKRARRVERHEEQAAGPKLDEAPVVISGGRGLGDPSNFELLDQLAEVLGNAAVGATRAVVDAGWVSYALQVGQTGVTVKPSVYLAFGISGATQHIVGMKGAKRIVAVNKDEEAPIFQIADLGVVGDALKVLPALIEEIKARKA
jgi:electron transfer flavoprotein alpha subunit